MKSKTYYFLSILFIISFILLTFNIKSTENSESNFFDGKTIYVDVKYTGEIQDGTINYPFKTITQAINFSNDKDIIYVYNGTYYENIIINKSIKIYAEDDSYIDGSYQEFIINIITNNVTLENLIIKNSGGFNANCGIKINTDNNIIKNCNVYRTKDGIYINKSFNNLIINSYFHTNGAGIILYSAQKNIINNCYFEHNSIAIQIDSSNYNIIQNSSFHTNGISCYFTDSSYNKILQCNISNNVDNHGGIFTDNSTSILVNNTLLIHNGIGIHIDNSKNVNINNCRLYFNTHYAIIIRKNSENINISECEIFNNLRFGIYIMENCKSTITKNNIYNNTLYGLYSKQSICNTSGNWWGSKYGPSIFEFGVGDRIYPILNRFYMNSWLYNPLTFEDLEINNENIFNYNNSEYNLKIIEYIPGEDTDNDGATDYWEEKWGYNQNQWDDHLNLDPDDDYLNNLEECYTDKYGSNPYKRDIFLEIDWMEPNDQNKSNKPSMFLLNRAIKNFKDHNITLHIDIGELEGGEEIPSCNLTFSFARLRDIYWNYFLHNDLNNPRKGIFHYGIICNYCPDLSFPFVGWDQFDSYAISVEWTKTQSPIYTRQSIITGGSLHQLGSTLGLLVETHGGNDNLGTIKPLSIQWLKYLNYKSCMNYNYKYEIFSYSDGSHGPGDFNDWCHLDLSFFKNSNFGYIFE